MFSIIIFFHELGHFLLAKKNGITVTEFSIGMGPRIISTVKGGTRYSLKILPFGGSCAMGEDEDDFSEGSFKSKSVGARIAVIAAGPIFNFILAFVFAIIVISVVGYDKPEITQVIEGSSAQKAGLQAGDVITKINGRKINLSREFSIYSYLHEDKLQDTVNLSFKRDGETHHISYKTDKIERYKLGFDYSDGNEGTQIDLLSTDGVLAQSGVEVGDIIKEIDGVAIHSEDDLAEYLATSPLTGEKISFTYEHKGTEHQIEVTPELVTDYSIGIAALSPRVKVPALGVFKYSAAEVKYVVSSTLENLYMLIRGKFTVNDLAGPVGVVEMIGSSYETNKQSDGMLIGFISVLNLAILISANLGVVNLLPIPALDGGRLVFLIIEGIRGKAIDPDKEGMVHFVGFVLLMLLMVVVLFNDIRRIF